MSSFAGAQSNRSLLIVPVELLHVLKFERRLMIGTSDQAAPGVVLWSAVAVESTKQGRLLIRKVDGVCLLLVIVILRDFFFEHRRLRQLAGHLISDVDVARILIFGVNLTVVVAHVDCRSQWWLHDVFNGVSQLIPLAVVHSVGGASTLQNVDFLRSHRSSHLDTVVWPRLAAAGGRASVDWANLL